MGIEPMDHHFVNGLTTMIYYCCNYHYY